MSNWWERKIQGGPPQQRTAYPPQPQQAPPAYYPPQPPPQQVPPAYYAQPVPGAPPHAPFGFDQATGRPIAPYGYDQQGNVMLQPPYQPPPQQYAPPPTQAYAPNGLPAAYPPQSAPPGWMPDGRGGWMPDGPTVLDDQGHVHYWDAAMHFKGSEGVQAVGTCPKCGGPLVPRNEGGQNRVLNTNTGVMADPAPECATCGYNGKFEQMASGNHNGIAVHVDGPARAAPGAKSLSQVESQHGLPNLFAHKT